MNWMAFVASIVRSIAWPTAAVLACVILRSKLDHLLLRVKRGNVGPAGLEWELFDEVRVLSESLEDEGAQLETALEAVKAGTGEGDSLVSSEEPLGPRERAILERLTASRPDDLLGKVTRVESETFARLAEISPTAAALQRHAEMEGTIREIVNGLRRLEDLPAKPWQHTGRELGLLTPEDDRALVWLRRVKNELSHGRIEINTALAFDFGRLAEQVETNVVTRALLQFERHLKKLNSSGVAAGQTGSENAS